MRQKRKKQEKEIITPKKNIGIELQEESRNREVELEDGELKNVVEIEESEQIKEEEHGQVNAKIVEMVQQESEKIIEELVERMVENIVENK